MKTLFPVIIVVVALVLVCSCASGAAVNGGEPSWAGIYTGVTPAADCPGIVMVVILNAEGRYKITRQYIDRDDHVFSDTGAYVYDEKTKGLFLDGRNIPSYRVGKNTITILDGEGNEISSGFAHMLILKKL